MSTLPLLEDDEDLVPLLRAASDEDLDPLVGYILGGPDGMRLTSMLDTLDVYQANRPKHSLYADEIASEIQTFGGNSVANLVRGSGVYYREVVADVCAALKIRVAAGASVPDMELQVHLALLTEAWKSMTDEERREFMKDIGLDSTSIPKTLPIAVLQMIFRSGGFQSHIVLMKIASWVAWTVLKRGFKRETMSAINKYAAVLAGPIPTAIMSLWSVYDITGPALRVTIPSVVHIGMLRATEGQWICAEGHICSKAARFCPECGGPRT